MDTYSSGEDLLVKTRKPYTITKQRERWTEDEHNRFLEALKLHGRAWQRIEEHIGTKTAVQIRSHAQKFFSKLEKEALLKGVPVGQSLDIDIPPPRPKRKPSNPYPRKTCQTPTSLVGAKDGNFLLSESSPCKQLLDLEKEHLPERDSRELDKDLLHNYGRDLTLMKEIAHNHAHNYSQVQSFSKERRLGSKPCGEGKTTHKKENQGESCSEALTQLKGLGNSCSFREFMPSIRNENKNDNRDYYVAVEINRNQNFNNPDDGTDATIEDNETSKGSQLEQKTDSDLNRELPSEEFQATQNYPRHVPVHVLDGRTGSKKTNSPDLPFQEPKFHNHNFFPSSSTSDITHEHQSNAPRSSNHQSFQPFSPLLTSSVRRSQEEHQSFPDISSTFSNLIVSMLFQNPAAHAAANFAASFWPYCGKPSLDSAESSHSGSNPAPGMAAIAAATVAAATAWWASHGLLPVCAPLLHGSFPCTPPPVGLASSMETDQAPNPPLQDQMELENSDTNSKGGDDENAAEAAEPRDSDGAKNGKLVDRSSCGSNTASSSDIETDALEKKEEEKEELEEPENENPASESNIRRSRNNCSSNPSDSWKEVSEEGRLAFQALFSREVLPQSFSPPPNLKNMREDERERIASLLDLNIRAWGFCYNLSELEKNASQKDSNLDDGALTIGLGQGQGRLKARRTGFKPYKRCSGEVKDSRLGNPGSQVEEKANKRLRLEGEVQLNI